MTNTKPFYDLCLSDELVRSEAFPRAAKRLKQYGYRTVAANSFVSEDGLVQKKKNKKDESREARDCVPRPATEDAEVVEDLTVLSRLTIIFSRPQSVHDIMKSENCKKYDIVALLPTSLAALQFACSTAVVDLITFDPENSSKLRITWKLYSVAARRGLYFEVMYSPAIEDRTKRKNIICQSHDYHAKGKSVNIIVSSWATRETLLRGAHDVMNLGLVLGLSEEQSRNAITTNCKDLLLRAEGRRAGKSVVVVKSLRDKTETMEIDRREIGEEEEEAAAAEENGATAAKTDDVDDNDDDLEMIIEDEPAQKKTKQ